MSSWVICWEYCCCFWICSASDCIAPSHSACAPSAPRSILLLAECLSIMLSPYRTYSLQKSLVYPHEDLPNRVAHKEDRTRAGPVSRIHRSAWKGFSLKLNFRFTEF